MLPVRYGFLLAASLLLLSGSLAPADEPERPPAGDRDDDDASGDADDEGDANDDDDDDDAPKGKGKGKRARTGGRDLDPESPTARKLDELLHVPHAYAKDGTVRLVYPFTEARQVEDFDLTGFDRAEEVGGKKGRNALKTNRMAIGAGSQRPGLMLHELPLHEAWEVRVTGRITRMAPSSDLVVFVGKAGVRFGTQLVGRTGRGFAPLERSADPDREPFDRGRSFEVVLRCREGSVTAVLNGQVVASSDRFGDAVEGKVGLYAKNLMLIVDRITIEGRVDPSKL